MPATDISALGRLGQPLSTSGASGRHRGRRAVRSSRAHMPAVRRRRWLPRSVGAGLVVAAIGIAWLGVVAGSQAQGFATPDAAPLDPTVSAQLARPAGEQDDVGTRALVPGGGEATEAASATVPFAAVDDLVLRLPSLDAEEVAFQEADAAAALTLAPLGRMVANASPELFAPPPEMTDVPYRVLEVSSGVRSATSLAEVVVPEGAMALAPVDGEVVGVREHALAGGTREWRISLLPTERPDLHVVVRHLLQPVVAVGDAVVAGVTPLGVVRGIDDPLLDAVVPPGRVTAGVLVRPAQQELPFDPNEPAVAAAGGR